MSTSSSTLAEHVDESLEQAEGQLNKDIWKTCAGDSKRIEAIIRAGAGQEGASHEAVGSVMGPGHQQPPNRSKRKDDVKESPFEQATHCQGERTMTASYRREPSSSNTLEGIDLVKSEKEI